MADQGASQRRGFDTTASTPIGQSSTLSPQGSSGDTYFDSTMGSLGGNDVPSEDATYKDTQVTTIGLDTTQGTNATSSAQGRSYREIALGPVTGNDIGSSGARTKENQISPIGQTGNATATTSASGAYFESDLGALSSISSTSSTTAVVVTYKLRARDSACITPTYVEWTTTTTPLSTSSYTGALPCGGPLVELTVLSQHT